MAFLDVGFEWPIDDSGYEIIDPPRSRRRGSVSGLIGDGGPRLVRKGGKLRVHRPLEFHTSLYLDFAALAKVDDMPEGCVKFADAFGYLGAFPSEKADDYVGAQGEPLSTWKDCIGHMSNLVAIKKSHEEHPDSRLLAHLKVANLDALLLPSPPDGRLALRIRPRSLIGAMYLQFAQAVSRDLAIQECEHCGGWFEAGGNQRRRKARFCSDKCRYDFNNAKKRRAS